MENEILMNEDTIETMEAVVAENSGVGKVAGVVGGVIAIGAAVVLLTKKVIKPAIAKRKAKKEAKRQACEDLESEYIDIVDDSDEE